MRATWAPASAIALEASQPMPRVPPVTTATFPSRRNRERTFVSLGGPARTITYVKRLSKITEGDCGRSLT